MTNFEALKASVMYPVEDVTLKKALFDRGLTDTDTYSLSVKKEVDLCSADVMVTLITAPNISEGGYSVTLSDKAILKQTASAIYSRYGVFDPFTLKPTVKGARPW